MAVVLTLGATSCNKEENIEGERLTHFYASCETDSTDTKTYLSGNYMYWNTNDSVRLWGTGDDRGYIYKVKSGGSSSAEFVYARTGNAPVLNGPYTIGYPSRFWNSKNVVTLPATQKYVANGANDIPQYAYVNSTTMSSSVNFFNICGLVRLRLTKPSTNVSSISITTNSPIYGNFNVSTSYSYSGAPNYRYGYIPSLSYSGNGGNTVTLNCTTPQSINSQKTFNIYIPAKTYTQFEITITTSDNKTITKTANSSIVVGRSQITTITLNADDLSFDQDFPCLDGLFSVSASKQVKFSAGNLQCINSAWQFAENQYDCLGTYSSTAWDLFGWSTETTDFGMSTSTDNSNYSTSFFDWGTAINPGAASTPWRTLTDAEWTYLLSGRTNASNLYGMATITDVTIPGTTTHVTGMVILPDNWTAVSSVSFTPGGSVNANQLTAAQWEILEDNGAVFLPAAGRRGGTTLSNVGQYGNYWSATNDGTTNAYYMGFATATASANRSAGRSRGCAVRLVQED